MMSKMIKLIKGPSIKDVGTFSGFLTSTPLPLHWQFFTTIRRQIWPIFDPSPPKKCRRL